MHLFAQLVKVDEATRTVYGRAVQEVPDHAGEIFDYESSAPYFKSWSEDVAKITDGKSVGNVRAMHGKVAAGKLTELTGNDTEKAFDVAAQIVDDNEWKKCQEGVYTGFSIGGRYVKKWQDGDFTRYTAQPNEISLVDAPCVPTARFTVVKADGSEVEQEFAAAEGLLKQHWFCGIDEHRHLAKDDARKCIGDQAIEKAEAALIEAQGPAATGDEPGPDLAKSLSSAVKEKFLSDIKDSSKNPTHDLSAAIRRLSQWAASGRFPTGCNYGDLKWMYNQIVKEMHRRDPKSKAGGNFPAEGSAKKAFDADGLTKCQALTAALKTTKEAAESKGKGGAKKSDEPTLKKGLYGVARFADLLESLNCLAESQKYEESIEQDGSTMSSRLKAAVGALGDLLVDMATEETKELTDGDDVEVLTLSETGEIEKAAINAGRYPALAKAIEFSHANPTGDGSGTAPTASEVSMDEKAVQKLLEERDGKIAKHLEKIDSQESTIQEQGETILKLNERLEKLEAGPAPAKGRRLVVSKGADAGDHTDGAADDGVDEMAEKLEKMSPEDRATLLIKVSQRHPSVVTE